LECRHGALDRKREHPNVNVTNIYMRAGHASSLLALASGPDASWVLVRE
jgi:hypothetical protein